jgi:ABC-type nickel/cobalt efflux system permease component RcnA
MFKKKSHPSIPKLVLRNPLKTSFLYGISYVVTAMVLSFASFYVLQSKGFGLEWYKDPMALTIFSLVHVFSIGLFVISSHRELVKNSIENNKRMSLFIRSLYDVDMGSISSFIKDNDGSSSLKYELIKDHFVMMSMRKEEQDGKSYSGETGDFKGRGEFLHHDKITAPEDACELVDDMGNVSQSSVGMAAEK